MTRLIALLFVTCLLAACASKRPAPASSSAPSNASVAPAPMPTLTQTVEPLVETGILPYKISYVRPPKGHKLRREYGGLSKDRRVRAYAERCYDEILDVGNSAAARVSEAPRMGKVIVSISILASGALEEVEIDSPSKFKDVNASILRAVQLAAPFPPFPRDLAKEYQAVTLTKTFLYVPD